MHGALDLLARYLLRELLNRNHDRRVRDDPELAVDDVSQLRECAHAVFRLRLGDGAVELFRLLLPEFRVETRADRLCIEP